MLGTPPLVIPLPKGKRHVPYGPWPASVPSRPRAGPRHGEAVRGAVELALRLVPGGGVWRTTEPCAVPHVSPLCARGRHHGLGCASMPQGRGVEASWHHGGALMPSSAPCTWAETLAGGHTHRPRGTRR